VCDLEKNENLLLPLPSLQQRQKLGAVPAFRLPYTHLLQGNVAVRRKCQSDY